jgi:hypothetical protein
MPLISDPGLTPKVVTCAADLCEPAGGTFNYITVLSATIVVLLIAMVVMYVYYRGISTTAAKTPVAIEPRPEVPRPAMDAAELARLRELRAKMHATSSPQQETAKVVINPQAATCLQPVDQCRADSPAPVMQPTASAAEAQSADPPAADQQPEPPAPDEDMSDLIDALERESSN